MRTPKTERRQAPIAERFANKVLPVPEAGCWLWTGSTNRGYGSLSAGAFGLAPVLAHRLSWELHKGEIPDGLYVCHKCDTRLCVNPDHLFLGTHTENVQDAARKARLSQKLDPADVAAIRAATGTEKQRDTARRFGVSQALVSKIQRRRTWKHTPDPPSPEEVREAYAFKYED